MRKYRLVIAGGRGFNDYNHLSEEVSKYINDLNVESPEDLEIIVGGAKGADTLGKEYAQRNFIPYTLIKADWDKHGKSAGYIRNAEMVDRATHVIAFWNKVSNGTRHTINYATKKGLGVKVVYYVGEK